MASTLRLPGELKTEAETFAARLGISMNALVAVALRDYLDGRHMPRSVEHLPDPPSSASPGVFDLAPQASTPPALAASMPGPPVGHFKAPRSRADPCPCGTLDANGHRLKWKQCHGRKP